MKTFSAIFAILAAASFAAYLMGHTNHLTLMGVCLTMAFVAWPDKKEESHE